MIKEPVLLDRVAEKETLAGLLEDVRNGLSGVIVLIGEAGVGKSILLEYAAEQALDMDIARAVGIESEMELGFATLHQLLMPFMDRLERLPGPQREALGAAFGLVAAPRPSLFLVGLAALTLLGDAAAERPVLCLVDDAQWADEASAGVLGFIARRLLADHVGMLFTVRDESGGLAALGGLAELRVEGLPTTDAQMLLTSVATGGLDRRVGERIILETRGNPLALVELSRELSDDERSGRVPLRQPLPIGRRLEERFLERVRGLPAESQSLLLLAATQDLGDPTLLWRAGAYLGIGPQAADVPDLEALLAVEPRIAFVHPLVRSAVYQGASAHDRRRAHDALARATDPALDPDRRAWHQAESTMGPDEGVAIELERSAGRAGARGGLASAAAFLERAAELSADDSNRYRRLVTAADAEYFAGAPARALALLDRAKPLGGDSQEQAHALWVRGAINLILGDASEAASYALQAAIAFEPLDIRAARDAMLYALQFAFWAGHEVEKAAVASRVLSHPPESQTTAADLLLDGSAAVHFDDWATAAPLLRGGIARLRAGEMPGDTRMGVANLARWQGCWAALRICDLEGWRDLGYGVTESLRDIGALTVLPYTLDDIAVVEVHCGRFELAEAHLSEAIDVLAATGVPGGLGTMVAGVTLRAHQGNELATRAEAARLRAEPAARGQHRVARFAREQMCILDLSLGNYQEAFVAAQEVCSADPLEVGIKALPDLVEAASRAGDRQAAVEGLSRLRGRALASGTPWALGLLARSEALLASKETAEELYRDAIIRLTHTEAAVDLGRAHLLYGEWLRRQRRRNDSRIQLRSAHNMFDAMGASAFAERALGELLAAGEPAGKKAAVDRYGLTAQEERIARLAANRSSNHEIAANLFISANTVDYHLRKVFRKLDVTHRSQLADKLTGAPDTDGQSGESAAASAIQTH